MVTSPAPFTLLSYKGGYPSRWPQGRRGDECLLFFPLLRGQPGERCGGWEGGRGGKGRVE